MGWNRYAVEDRFIDRGNVNTVHYIDQNFVALAMRGPAFVMIADNARSHCARLISNYLVAEGIIRIDPLPMCLTEVWANFPKSRIQ